MFEKLNGSVLFLNLAEKKHKHLEINYYNLLLALTILIFLSRVYIYLAKRFGISDVPNERSSHTVTVTRGGGILFPIGALLFFVFSGFEYPFFFFGLLLLAIISFIDDVKSLSVKQRIPIQLGAISLALFQLDMFNSLGIGGIIGFIVLIGVGLVFVNCFNFIDGINGMLGFYSLSVLIPLLIINIEFQVIEKKLLLFLIMATLVFGYYNFRKRALFFSGDVGSISLGLIFFFLMVKFVFSLKAPILLLFVIVFLTDTLGTIYIRIISGKSIFQASRDYMYERMVNEKKIPHLITATYYAILQLTLSVVAILFYKQTILVQLLVLAISVIFMIILFFVLDKKIPKDSSRLAA